MRLVICLLVCCTLPSCHWARAAAEPELQIVSRQIWGARPPRADISTYEEYALEQPEYTMVVLHVTSMGHGVGIREMRRIQDFHMNERGFSDIGYNYLIDSEGMIFEGRTLALVPSHAGRSVEGDTLHDITLDPDYQAIGIVFSAETDESLTPSQVDSAVRLIEQLKSQHPLKSIITHTEVKQRLTSRGLTPHTEFDPQMCPGPGSIEQIIQIRRALDPKFDDLAYRALFEVANGPPDL